MTKPLNLYLLSRIPDREAFNNVYHHAGEMPPGKMTPVHEIESLRVFTNRMIDAGVPVSALDGFVFGYSIPRIGKEFDLLKFGNDGCLNVELKSMPVPLEQMRVQLLKNRHYLAHLGMATDLYTFVSDTQQCFHLTDDGQLQPVSHEDLAKAVLAASGDYQIEIDGLFRPSEYIVSPRNTPEKFLMREYFLTQAQEQVRNGLLEALGETDEEAFFSLTGKPGTGKTLLLYDVGRTLSRQSSVVILHWGTAPLPESLQLISDADDRLDILTWSVLGPDDDHLLSDLAPYTYVLVDEAHRLTPQQFRNICRTANDFHQRVIFSMDPEQILSSRDRANNIAGLIEALPPTGAFILSERLRGNPDLLSFIRLVYNLNDKPAIRMNYKDVDLCYAGTIAEARHLLEYYRSQGYIFINYLKTAHPQPAEAMQSDEHPDTSSPNSEQPNSVSPISAEPEGQLPDTASPNSEQPNSVSPISTEPQGQLPDTVLSEADAKPAGSEAGNPFIDFEGGYDIHHVIGQEFDRVVMLLDSSFRYSADGKLEGVPRPDPDHLYPNLFYQSITRVQEKLSVIVLENEPLFAQISELLEP